MDVCVDSKIFQDSQTMNNFLTLLQDTVECYNECDFKAPCRNECQQNIVKNMPQEVTNYISLRTKTVDGSDRSASSSSVKGGLLSMFLIFLTLLN